MATPIIIIIKLLVLLASPLWVVGAIFGLAYQVLGSGFVRTRQWLEDTR